MADALDSNDIARHSFGVGRRGYEQQEVRAFLHEVSSLVERLQRELSELRQRAERAEARLGLSDELDESTLLEILGEETTRVLTSARDAAAQIRNKAESSAERIIGDATSEAADTRADAVREADRRLAEATAESESLLAAARVEMERRGAEGAEAAARIREEAAAEAQSLRDEGQRDLERMREEAEAERDGARLQGREMVAEAQAVRERVLRDLAVRRKKARQQVEKLNAGRERLLEAYDVVRRTVDEATGELSTALSDARIAADAAARRIDEEPDPTLEQLDDEIATAALVDLPIVDLGEPGDESSGPFSGEVPAIDLEPDVEQLAGAADPELEPSPTIKAPPLDLDERRGRRSRRRKREFEGLPAGELTRVEPPAEGEGIRILEEPAVDADSPPAPADAVATDEVTDETAEETTATDDEEAPGPEPTEAAASDSSPEEGDDGDAAPASVDDLFERLRAEREEGDDSDGPAEPESQPADDGADADADDGEGAPGPDEDVVDEVEATEHDDPPESPPAEPTPFTERDAALLPVDKELARRLKRVLADEQNEVLDLLRRAKPKGVDDLLPSPEDHASRWAEVAGGALADAATAGATWSGGAAGSVTDLTDELAQSLTAPLRDRIDRSFVASDGNLDDVADRVRALYREWKGKRLTDTSRHYVAAAYTWGAYDALAASTEVHWVVDPTGGPCPDCDDNVLGGTLTKGDAFPTGHRCAPAHPGCRCLVLSGPA